MNFDEILSGKNLYTVFQPIVSLETGDVFAYEALTRIDESVYIGSIKNLFKISEDASLSWQLEKKCIKSALKTARAPQGTSAKQLLEYLIDIFEAFTEAVPLRDDLTVIVLKYLGE